MHSTAGDRRANEIGSRIREARKHCGLTSQDLAAKAGIHANTLSNVERGRSEPSNKTLQRIAAALQQPLEAIVGPPTAQGPHGLQVLANLERFRADNPHAFEEWTHPMWERYVALGARFAIANEPGARFFAERVKREFLCITQLRALFDASEETEVVAFVSREHSRIQQIAAVAASGETQRHPAHTLPPSHHVLAMNQRAAR